MNELLGVTANDELPVMTNVDVLVVEGTLAGCIAAYEHAKAGRKTALSVAVCSVPHEMVTCRRPWVTTDDLSKLPAAFKKAFESAIEESVSDDCSLMNLTMLSIAVEDLLMDAGVQVFYGMTPCGVKLTSSGEVASTIFAGKFGLLAIDTKAVVDTTPTAILSRLSQCEYTVTADSHVTVRISAKIAIADDKFANKIDTPQGIQACPTAWPEESIIELPDEPAMVNGQVSIFGNYIEFVLRIATNCNDPLDQTHLSVQTRMKMLDIGCRIDEMRKAAGKPSYYIHRYSGALLCDPMVTIQKTPPNLTWLQAQDRSDPYSSAESVGSSVPISDSATNDGSHIHLSVVSGSETDQSKQFRFLDKTTCEKSVSLGALTLPVLAETDVLVAGGGTSGMPCALAAAQAGGRVILIEQHADVGGTQTVGGVGNYWFGRETPYQLACDKAYESWSSRSGMAREIAMLKCLTDAGVAVLAPMTLAGVIREGDHLVGVVVATDQGLAIVRSKTVIDATGDADIAAWAGVSYDFGNGRDAWTIWASFANFNKEKRTANRQYESSSDVNDPQDFVRTIVRGRRRQGMWSRLAHDLPQLYVAPRETRRIHGNARITYPGILAGETFEDVITVCDSNFDIKGVASSDLIYCGVMWGWKAHIRYLAAIPFRAIQPMQIDNLLIVGRSYSATHDAQSLARMQRDMASLGSGAGIAAVQAIQDGVSLVDLDIKKLQEQLVKVGTIRPDDLHTFGQHPKAYTEADAQRDVDELLTCEEVSAALLARLALSPISIAPLRTAFEKVTDDTVKTHIARVLCYLSDDIGVEYLIQQVEQQISEELPKPQAATLSLPPEHGWAPEPAYSLYAIGLVGRGQETIHLLERIAEQIVDDAETFNLKDASPFEYIRTICAVADRNPSAQMIRPLDLLYHKQCIRNLSVPADSDSREILDPSLERRAYCEISLGRALARCGDPRGYEILEAYKNDARHPLARSAMDELAELLDAPLATSQQFKPYRQRID